MWALYEWTYDTRCGEGEHGSSEKKSYKRKSWISRSRSNWANEDILNTRHHFYGARELKLVALECARKRAYLEYPHRAGHRLLPSGPCVNQSYQGSTDGSGIIEYRLHLRRQQGWSVRRTLSFLSFFSNWFGFFKNFKKWKIFHQSRIFFSFCVNEFLAV